MAANLFKPQYTELRDRAFKARKERRLALKGQAVKTAADVAAVLASTQMFSGKPITCLTVIFIVRKGRAAAALAGSAIKRFKPTGGFPVEKSLADIMLEKEQKKTLELTGRLTQLET